MYTLSTISAVKNLRHYGPSKKELFLTIVIGALVANYLTDWFYLALDASGDKHGVKGAVNALLAASTMIANIKPAQSEVEADARRRFADNLAKFVVIAGTFMAGLEWLLSGTGGLTVHAAFALVILGGFVVVAAGISEDDANRSAGRKPWARVGQRRNRAWSMESDSALVQRGEPNTGAKA